MSISENLLLFISGVGILQAFILAAVIYFHPRSDRSVTTFLSLYIASFGVASFFPVIHQYFPWQYLLFLDPFLLLSGPFLYFYVRSFKEVITFRKVAPHLILFGLFAVFNTWQFGRLMNLYPDTETIPRELIQSWLSIAKHSIRIGQFVLYCVLASRALTSYQQSIRHLFSETSKINLAWIRWLISGFIVLAIALIVMYGLMLQYPDNLRLLILINTAFPTPYIYLATFKGITQPTLWQLESGMNHAKVEEKIHEVEAMEAGLEDGEARKSGLTREKIQEISAKAIALMEQGRVYLEAELTLQQLADRLQLPSYLVSQAINEGIRKNFYDLVNGYRVEEAKRLLLDPRNRNYKVISVAYDAGFNSKTTFNTVFKKFTGFTPTDFRTHEGAA